MPDQDTGEPLEMDTEERDRMVAELDRAGVTADTIVIVEADD